MTSFLNANHFNANLLRAGGATGMIQSLGSHLSQLHPSTLAFQQRLNAEFSSFADLAKFAKIGGPSVPPPPGTSLPTNAHQSIPTPPAMVAQQLPMKNSKNYIKSAFSLVNNSNTSTPDIEYDINSKPANNSTKSNKNQSSAQGNASHHSYNSKEHPITGKSNHSQNYRDNSSTNHKESSSSRYNNNHSGKQYNSSNSSSGSNKGGNQVNGNNNNSDSKNSNSKPELNPACLPRCNCEELMKVDAKLETKELWEKFHELGTEMIITKTGRRYVVLFICLIVQ